MSILGKFRENSGGIQGGIQGEFKGNSKGIQGGIQGEFRSDFRPNLNSGFQEFRD
tara:strand:+ start:11009 stop:11173 length:165 start_codon:yes stop_codon:yes gene_type:complete